MDVPTARRIARPAWINLRSIAGLLLFLGAAVAGGRFLEAAHTTVPAWAAARDLAPGDVIGAADVRVVNVNLPAEVGARYPSSARPPTGQIVTRAVSSGTLIPSEAIAAEAAAGPGRTLTIPVTPEHAVGGVLAPGDIVDVFATDTEAGAGACTTAVARAVEVVGVVSAGGLVLEGEALAGITIAVSPAEAAAVAHAIRTAEIDIARVTAPGIDSPPPRVCRDDAP